MNIIILALGANMGGSIRHLSNFIPALFEQNTSDHYILILRNDTELNFENKLLQIVRVPKLIGANFLLRTLFDLVFLPFYAIIKKTNLVISLLNFGPVFLTKPHINFQRNALFFCPDYIIKLTGIEKIQPYLRSLLLFLTMKYADIIVTPSNTMANQIKKRFPSLELKRIETLYHGFRLEEQKVTQNFWSETLLNEKRVKFLYPTHPAPHKGFEVLFNALAKFKEVNKNINFILYTTIEYKDWPKVVGKYEKQIKRLGIEDSVIFTGRITQDQMQFIYKNCDLMIYPSLCESFGFSMVEALGYGLPIVAADTEINREICGDAAIYYSAHNPEDAAQKILKGISMQGREDLKNRAETRISTFDWSWERYVKEFLTIVENFK